MKIVAAIARYFLGLVFFVFGLQNFLNFMHAPLPPGAAGEFLGLLVTTHYAYVIGAVMLVSGILFLANRFVALGLVLLGPISSTSLCFIFAWTSRILERA